MILLITPPSLQTNSPYPATAYLKGYLTGRGINASQFDLSIELACKIFSSGFLASVFSSYPTGHNAAEITSEATITACDEGDASTQIPAVERHGNEIWAPESAYPNLARIYALRNRYITTIDTVMEFLRKNDAALANLICMPDFIPQAGRFEAMPDPGEAFGSLGTQDCAKYIATLYLQDISDYIRATVSPHFEIVKYAEKISLSVASFRELDSLLAEPLNMIEEQMLGLLHERIEAEKPKFVGFTVPFPGNLVPALRCAQYIRKEFPGIRTIMGGGYASTELRSMSDKGIFRYFDYVVLDDGELAIERIVGGGPLVNTYTSEKYHTSSECITHAERGCPDFSGLPHDKYFSLCEVANPMHRLWTDGRWNKMMLAHGCYWAKCAFCDTSLDYIGRYEGVAAATLVDWMEEVARQTGSRGFHFTDEAAPPKLLRDISIELIRRGLNFSWWTNIRFEAAFTGDLCRLMATAGCIAVSGGLEAATDRLLAMVDKGVTIETATMTLRNFFYAGIMTHTYLMYGLPTQTLQETVDSLEIVRQMFRAELIGSGFWHRYAMTVHSPSGCAPERFGVKRKNAHVNTFANNEVFFVEDRGYNIASAGDSLRTALAHYMAASELDRPVHKWFEGKAPHTSVEETEITDHLIKPDSSRIYDDNARLVWIGAMPQRMPGGIAVEGNSRSMQFAFGDHDADFMIALTEKCSDLGRKVSLGEIKTLYAQYTDAPFSTLYHSKKWDRMREFGLLQV